VSNGGIAVAGAVVEQSTSIGFRWTAATGMPSIGILPGGTASVGIAISADGLVVAGASGVDSTHTHAIRWTAATGLVDLGTLPGELDSGATGISADGSIVVGSSGVQPFRWTAATGLQPLGLPPGWNHAEVTAVSADGRVVVGNGGGPTEGWHQAFRWTAATGSQVIGPPPPGRDGILAFGVNADGSVVVGTSELGSTHHAAIWTASLGWRELSEYLPTLGIDPTGWNLLEARGIAAGGRAIAGKATLSGFGRAFIVQLDTACAANCDASTAAPVLNVNDFVCFLGRFAAGDPYANCDNSTTPPLLNVNDFTCFVNHYAAGCP
jgi:probable HAF family extracellular repeat protein